jgi:hypothetical protein
MSPLSIILCIAARFGKSRLATIIVCLTGLLVFNQVARSDEVILYDDTLGTLPAAQPWLLYADDGIISGGTADETGGSFGVTLNTDNAVSAGYSNTNPITNAFKNGDFPTLDRGTGFRLTFEMQLNSEFHVSDDRAGFSVILLADDARGIELGFWDDQVWAQNDNPLFERGESTAFDTTAAEVVYQLTIVDQQYTLTADGNQLLTNSIRDYSAFGGAPYTLGNYLFIGDNTGSAGANVNLGRISIAAVPEPGSLALLGSGSALLLLVRRRR